ncbi:MAG TPA: tRNA (N6-isopentenyl adenosine(37)-C2)-methylthiotransferase MiaB [Candidatus Baltobacteraceae bacterium]|jgi:tRNA-2-methylthio-N6-dimethylallyladenosine synthase|nr:tRNA (N6-isopentenyl adenosine(37)-C2)-methylthiotransferase MiaB [Candidatus Baltobacteraceae bacterium]
MASIYIETFGCQMNEADSQFIAERAMGAGYDIAARPEEANVVILNTCTVRENAERRAYGRMHHLKILKQADPALKLVVMGCLAEQDRAIMQKKAPHVDAVFGTSELVQMADAIAQWRPEFEDTEFSEERALLMPFGGAADCITDAYSHLRGFVTVQRGCSYYCTFCIVPHVRGRFDHRPSGVIADEVAQRVATGAREVLLVGQTVNAYKDAVEGTDFGDLCKLVAQTAQLERLAFISPHPKDFTEKIVADLAQVDKLNPRVHLPLQSGSDAMLRRMNRKYTMDQFREKVGLFHRYLPHWAVTTDIIVGFPGETEEDFRATLDYVSTGVFANAYMFIYSPRRGTPAARWEQVPKEVAGERFKRLAQAQNAASRAYNVRKTGTRVRALIQGRSKKDAAKLCAKSPDNATIIAPIPPDYDQALYAREPWLDIDLHEGFIWGCTGTITARAPRYNAPATPVPIAPINLLSTA